MYNYYDLKESRYNIFVDLDDGSLIVYNTKTGSIIEVSRDERNHIIEVLNSPMKHESPYKNTLYDEGFLVDSYFDEVDNIKKIHEKYIADSKNIKITLLPAEACNMRCPYCFTYAKKNLFMQDWVYEGIFKYIENEVYNKHGTNLTIEWFGGEPTLAYDKIVNFMQRLKELERLYDLTVYSIMLSNGLLLNSEMLKNLYLAGVKTFQITLDGTKEYHDKLRLTKSGLHTYDTIWKNLRQIKQLDPSFDFQVYIRSNYTSDSEKTLDSLLEQFKTDLSDDKRFSIYFKPIYDFQTERSSNRDIAEKLCSPEERIKVQERMGKELYTLNNSNATPIQSLPSPIYSWCSAPKNDYYVIGANGALYCCGTLIGKESAVIGHIKPNGRFDFCKAYNDWKVNFLNNDGELENQCKNCKLLPICMGGCPRIRIENKMKSCPITMSQVENIIKKFVTESNI